MRKFLGSKYKYFLFALVILCIFSVIACSSGKGTDQSKESAQPKVTYLSMGTGDSGGTYYYIGAGFCNMVKKYYPEVQITAQSTAAAFENARLVATGKLDLGLTCGGTLQYLKNNDQLDISNVAFIAAGNRSDLHIMVEANSKITKMEDLKGKKVGVGPQGSATLMLYSLPILEAGWGLKADVDYKPVYYSFSEIARGLKEGTVDVGIIAAGFPISSVIDLCTTHKIRFLDTPPDVMKKINEKYPHLLPITIPANTYNGQDKDNLTITATQRLICRKDLPEDVVYKICKAIYEHEDEKNQIHPQAALWNYENALADATSDGVDIHPGAVKFFKEKGVIK